LKATRAITPLGLASGTGDLGDHPVPVERVYHLEDDRVPGGRRVI